MPGPRPRRLQAPLNAPKEGVREKERHHAVGNWTTVMPRMLLDERLNHSSEYPLIRAPRLARCADRLV